MEVLTEEFDEKGIHVSHDKYGFQNITGLTSKQKTLAPSRQKLDSNRGELRGFRRIEVAGGVSLKEPKDMKRVPQSENDYVKISGGAYRPSQNKHHDSQSSIGNACAYRMTVEEYAKLSGTRKYITVT